jgi:hypothetical protein
MTSKDFSELINEVNEMSAQEIAEVIFFEDMTDDQADQFQNAIPAEMVSEIMSKVE